MTGRDVPGVIYLLHFQQPYRHARHYLGWTEDLAARLEQHQKGQGARLLTVVREAGISWSLSRTWQGDRNRERQIKRMGGLSRSCPDCGVKPRIRQPIDLGRAAVEGTEATAHGPRSKQLEPEAGG